MDIIKAVAECLPSKKMALPLYGQRSDWNYHVLMCNPSMKDIWNRLTYSDIQSAFSTIYKMNISPMTIFRLRTAMKELFAFNFFGLNTMRYQGFTEFKDNRLSSYTDQLKYVLNPNEFVLWGEPVICMADCTITEVSNNRNDMISREALNSRPIMGDRMEELYGNYIGTVTDGGVSIFYCGLMKNSFLRYKVGEKIKAGQEIAKVGCSGAAAKRPFLHIEFGLSPISGLPMEDQYRYATFPVPLVNFEAFYEMPLWTDYRDTREGIERMYVKDIKYTYNPGHFMRAGSLIRKTINK